MTKAQSATVHPRHGQLVVPGVATAAVRNRLLQLVPARELAVVLQAAERVELKPRQVLHHWRLPMDYVYFVESGLVSVSAKVDDGRFIEAWLIGAEGMVGAPYLLAPDDTSPPHRRVVQVGGTALRIRTAAFTAIMENLPALREVLLRYINVVLLQTSQAGACNSLHSVKQRLARWLLLAERALDSPELPLTHAVLAQLLGVRRASVSEGLDAFEREGGIVNARAAIRITDQAMLEKAACSCFGLIQREYDRQIGGFSSKHAGETR
ncbi:Crp/Fnr family transcriptional regulator [Bradyrhizobium sp. HKCCYLS1011]|uniref:Crp/Fnr family transcriptional regulator n=1 Tax=Bradyrhizobium sp. HKCCYLS1011 TaxID=3420733 RepID=UPI003EC0B486